MWYIYKHPNFVIPKEFQDWLVWAWNWQHNWDTVIDISWKWNNWTQNWWVTFIRKNNTNQMLLDWSDDYVDKWNFWSWNWNFSIVTLFYNKWWTNKFVLDNRNDNEYWQWYYYQFDSNSETTLNVKYQDWSSSENWISIDLWDSILNTNVFLSFTHKEWWNDYLYKNWVSIKSVSATTRESSDSTTLSIWSRYSLDWWYFEWNINLILLYNKTLIPEQINKMYEYYRQ